MRPKTKYHPLLASAARLPPVSSSSHGRRVEEKRVHRGGECIHSAGSTTRAVFDHQGGCCTADCVTCCSTTVVQIPMRKLQSTAGTHCKQINVRIKNQIPYRTKNCAEYNKPTMDNEQKYSSGWEDCIKTVGSGLRLWIGKTGDAYHDRGVTIQWVRFFKSFF